MKSPFFDPFLRKWRRPLFGVSAVVGKWRLVAQNFLTNFNSAEHCQRSCHARVYLTHQSSILPNKSFCMKYITSTRSQLIIAEEYFLSQICKAVPEKTSTKLTKKLEHYITKLRIFSAHEEIQRYRLENF